MREDMQLGMYMRGHVIGIVYEIHVIGVCVQERMCM